MFFGAGTKLFVEPQSQPAASPSVFVMKNGTNVACLVKEFYPKDVTISLQSSKKIIEYDPAIVVSPGGRYSAVKLGQYGDPDSVTCSVEHNKKTVNSTEFEPKKIISGTPKPMEPQNSKQTSVSETCYEPQEIKDPNPTVYQLRSPESSDTSVCLFTDFDSEVQLTQITGSKWNMMHKTNSTALDMEVLGSKSNGIVTWGNTSDAGCKDTFSEDIVVAPSDGIACNAKLVEKSFETDMNLNSQNLSVIGFRILLLKVVGFNLLMTLRLWSS
ncbi:hypothetical protein G4228_008575 [Cervus hanglu yarkandensis]|nr:hypothetical protein G4228_008575 [Cervus hanglu yarkandensis]